MEKICFLPGASLSCRRIIKIYTYQYKKQKEIRKKLDQKEIYKNSLRAATTRVLERSGVLYLILIDYITPLSPLDE